MSHMNWAYVAGFFDGEGHLSYAGSASTTRIHWTLAITQKDIRPLRAIEGFLADHGIGGRVREHDRKARRGMHRLTVGQSLAVANMIGRMLPYLIVKKQLAEDVRRSILIWPPFSTSMVTMRAREAAKRTLTPEQYSDRSARSWRTRRDRYGPRGVRVPPCVPVRRRPS